MHFWLKRNEICTQIEGWIKELGKLQLTERVDRSMVLRRQYKQLREELAKLAVPPGLEDMDVPFSATPVDLPAAVPSAPSPAVGSEVPASATGATTVEQAPSSNATNFINIAQLSQQIETNFTDLDNHGLG